MKDTLPEWGNCSALGGQHKTFEERCERGERMQRKNLRNMLIGVDDDHAALPSVDLS